jgi:DNA-directed RNA polymerase specialized sigma subunit
MTVLTPTPSFSTASPTGLWREYRTTGDARLRDRLVFTLAPLVRHAAGEVDAEGAERGLSALLDAVDAYEPARDGELERYAWCRVRAAFASSR